MNLDLSAAPEIALLSGEGAPREPFGSRNSSKAPTAGSLAALVRETAADPSRWWGRVRFDPERPVRTRLDAAPGWELWLVTTPPGYRTGRDVPASRDGQGPPGGARAARGAGARGAWPPACEVITVVAGELAEYTATADGTEMRPLRPNRVRVRGHGQQRETVNPGGCYAVSLHAWS